jgi:hypothetical protein
MYICICARPWGRRTPTHAISLHPPKLISRTLPPILIETTGECITSRIRLRLRLLGFREIRLPSITKRSCALRHSSWDTEDLLRLAIHVANAESGRFGKSGPLFRHFGSLQKVIRVSSCVGVVIHMVGSTAQERYCLDRPWPGFDSFVRVSGVAVVVGYHRTGCIGYVDSLVVSVQGSRRRTLPKRLRSTVPQSVPGFRHATHDCPNTACSTSSQRQSDCMSSHALHP